MDVKPFANLAAALRQLSREADLQDTRESVKCLARLLEGKSVYEAFGAPGEWGYGRPIGDALAELYQSDARADFVFLLRKRAGDVEAEAQ